MFLQLHDQKSVLCAHDSDRPLTLIFAITTLNLFVCPLLHFSLKDPRPRRFVKVGDL